ncbi:MAG TPA: hypothetical protein VNJ11_14570 [Bryobacteraceae bacterium]|nr:hypothetical protein [Bryobacteraceae bacterium]
MGRLSASADWRVWAGSLSLLYLAVFLASSNRALIGTEIWALHYASQPLAAQMEAVRQDLVHPPLIYLLQRGWIAVFGAADRTVKLLPVVFNVPALFLFVWLARRVTSRWREAAVLFAGHYLLADSAVNLVRMYGLAVLLTLAALVVWELWRQQPSVRRLAAWTAIMTALVYTHYSGLLVLAGFVAANWFFGVRQKVFVPASAVPVLSFLPWLAYVYPVYAARGLETNLWWVEMLLAQPYKGLAMMAYEFLGSFPVEGAGRYAAVGAAVLVHAALLGAAVPALRRVWPPGRQQERQAQWLWTLVVFAGVPVALLCVFSLAYTPALAPRFLLVILPAYWLLLILLAELAGRRGARLLYGVLAPWVAVSVVWGVAESLRTPPLRRHVELVARELGPGDLVLCDPDLASHVYWELRHRNGRQARVEAAPVRSLEGLPPVERRAAEQAKRLSVVPARPAEKVGLQGVRRVWLFDSRGAPDRGVLRRLEEEGFRRIQDAGSVKPGLWLYVRPGA